MTPTKIRIVCVSDTHNRRPGEGYILPKGDILVHAGDLTNQGSYNELKRAVDWIVKADFAVKIVVAGNHDLSLDPDYALRHRDGWTVVPADVEACRKLVKENPKFIYLEHTETVVHLFDEAVSLRVFGSPYSPDRGKQNWAFQYDQGRAAERWSNIPSRLDILITHTPPAGVLDDSAHWKEGGCLALSAALDHARPRLHICGHCHEGRGAVVLSRLAADPNSAAIPFVWQDPGLGNKKQSLLDLTGKSNGPAFGMGDAAIINASVMTKSHGHGTSSCNKPIVVDILHSQGNMEQHIGERQEESAGTASEEPKACISFV